MRIVIAVNDPPIWVLPAAEVGRIRSSLPAEEVVEAPTADERRQLFPTADVLLTTWVSEEEAELFGRLRWIHSTAVGVGGLLRRGVVSRQVTITNSRGVHAEPIAEHALALALSLRRRLHVARARQLEGVWAQEELYGQRAVGLAGSCLLVVGLGAIGSRVAAMARGLGMRVIGVRARTDLPAPAAVDDVYPPQRLTAALSLADVVVLAAPHTRGTRAMIGRAELSAMRPSAVLVNVARGALVDEGALVEALEAGGIAGAGLDAFSREPLPAESPLWRLPNVLITPHTASFQGDYWPPAVDLFLDNMRRFARGEPLVNIVDPGRGY